MSCYLWAERAAYLEPDRILAQGDLPKWFANASMQIYVSCHRSPPYVQKLHLVSAESPSNKLTATYKSWNHDIVIGAECTSL